MKEKIIKTVAQNYHKLLRRHNFFPDFNQELKFYDSVSVACTEHTKWEKFILGVETAYFALPFHLRRIIKHSFFYKNYSFWWEEHYSPKQYRTFRKEAIECFYENLIKLKILNSKGGLKYVESN